MECSPLARLLFIGMWNFCDDGGNHPASVKTLKAEVFPGDNLTDVGLQHLVNELLTQSLIAPYEGNGKHYWHVTGWHHQKIEKPTLKYPAPTSIADQSPTVQREIVDSSPAVLQPVDISSPPEGKGDETKGGETKGIEAIATGKPVCPHQQIIDLYHEILSACPRIKDWTPARQAALKARWNESEERQNLDYWRRLFKYIEGIPFLTGEVARPGRKPFVISLDWLVKPENFAKVREGRYEDAAS